MTAVSDLLVGPGATTADALEAALSRTGQHLGDLGTGVASVTDAALCRPLAGLLEEPVGNLALRGWRQHRLVAVACERTGADPGSTEVVELFEHEISSTQRPRLEVFVDDVRVEVIHLDLRVALTVDRVGLTITEGRIAGWSAGTAVGSAELSASGVSLVRREHTVVDLSPTAPQAPV